MEIVIIGVIAGAALLCPLTMFGPAVLHRLGLRKRSPSSMSCMRVAGDAETAPMAKRLRAKRDELDREIAVLEASISDAGAELGIASSPGND